MKNRVPLNKRKKAKILAEFELCKETDVPGWLPDEGIMPYLDRINANPRLCTLISGFAPADECHCGCVNKSYLSVAADRKAYDKLKRLTSRSDRWDKMVYQGDEPLVEHYTVFGVGGAPDPSTGAPKTGLQIIDDVETYTSVDRVWFWCLSQDMTLHHKFWEELTEMLENL